MRQLQASQGTGSSSPLTSPLINKRLEERKALRRLVSGGTFLPTIITRESPRFAFSFLPTQAAVIFHDRRPLLVSLSQGLILEHP